MANKNVGRKSRNESRDWMDQDDRVRGRADEMEDASNDTEESEEFEDTEDLNDEDEEQGEGSF